MEKQFVSFEISGNQYCLDIMDVKEVVRESEITRLPDSPYFVEGIMNLRNIVVPVISLKKKLGLRDPDSADLKKAESEDSEHSKKLIIVGIEGVLVGFLVDALNKVITIDDSQVQAADMVVDSSLDKTMVNGVAKFENQHFLILNTKRMVDIEEKSFIQKEIVE